MRDDVPASSYVALGASADYASVGSFVNGGAYTGSGVLIAPDWVLTAGHLLLSGSSTFTIGGTTYTSSQQFVNPGWNGDVFHGSDFGLVHLSSPVSSVTPVAVYSGASEFGQVGTFVGYGFGGTGLTGWQAGSGASKRGFQNMIDGDFGNPSLVYGSDFDNPNSTADNGFGDATPLPLEGCVAPGDSGGGVFLTIGSQVYLAGIISFVASTDGNNNSDYGDYSGFGRISAVMPWITTTIPEPSVSTLFAGAGVIAFIVLRRPK